MTTFLVPCRKGGFGPSAAKDAYMDDPVFRDWRSYVEKERSSWFVVSTKHGLLAPDDLVPERYDRTIGAAMSDPAFIEALGQQLRAAGLRPERCVVLDADYFQKLVARAFGVPQSRVGFVSGISPHFRPKSS